MKSKSCSLLTALTRATKWTKDSLGCFELMSQISLPQITSESSIHSRSPRNVKVKAIRGGHFPQKCQDIRMPSFSQSFPSISSSDDVWNPTGPGRLIRPRNGRFPSVHKIIADDTSTSSFCERKLVEFRPMGQDLSKRNHYETTSCQPMRAGAVLMCSFSTDEESSCPETDSDPCTHRRNTPPHTEHTSVTHASSRRLGLLRGMFGMFRFFLCLVWRLLCWTLCCGCCRSTSQGSPERCFSEAVTQSCRGRHHRASKRHKRCPDKALRSKTRMCRDHSNTSCSDCDSRESLTCPSYCWNNIPCCTPHCLSQTRKDIPTPCQRKFCYIPNCLKSSSTNSFCPQQSTKTSLGCKTLSRISENRNQINRQCCKSTTTSGDISPKYLYDHSLGCICEHSPTHVSMRSSRCLSNKPPEHLHNRTPKCLCNKPPECISNEPTKCMCNKPQESTCTSSSDTICSNSTDSSCGESSGCSSDGPPKCMCCDKPECPSNEPPKCMCCDKPECSSNEPPKCVCCDKPECPSNEPPKCMCCNKPECPPNEPPKCMSCNKPETSSNEPPKCVCCNKPECPPNEPPKCMSCNKPKCSSNEPPKCMCCNKPETSSNEPPKCMCCKLPVCYWTSSSDTVSSSSTDSLCSKPPRYLYKPPQQCLNGVRSICLSDKPPPKCFCSKLTLCLCEPSSGTITSHLTQSSSSQHSESLCERISGLRSMRINSGNTESSCMAPAGMSHINGTDDPNQPSQQVAKTTKNSFVPPSCLNKFYLCNKSDQRPDNCNCCDRKLIKSCESRPFCGQVTEKQQELKSFCNEPRDTSTQPQPIFLSIPPRSGKGISDTTSLESNTENPCTSTESHSGQLSNKTGSNHCEEVLDATPLPYTTSRQNVISEKPDIKKDILNDKISGTKSSNKAACETRNDSQSHKNQSWGTYNVVNPKLREFGKDVFRIIQGVKDCPGDRCVVVADVSVSNPKDVNPTADNVAKMSMCLQVDKGTMDDCTVGRKIRDFLKYAGGAMRDSQSRVTISTRVHKCNAQSNIQPPGEKNNTKSNYFRSPSTRWGKTPSSHPFPSPRKRGLNCDRPSRRAKSEILSKDQNFVWKTVRPPKIPHTKNPSSNIYHEDIDPNDVILNKLISFSQAVPRGEKTRNGVSSLDRSSSSGSDNVLSSLGKEYSYCACHETDEIESNECQDSESSYRILSSLMTSEYNSPSGTSESTSPRRGRTAARKWEDECPSTSSSPVMSDSHRTSHGEWPQCSQPDQTGISPLSLANDHQDQLKRVKRSDKPTVGFHDCMCFLGGSRDKRPPQYQRYSKTLGCHWPQGMMKSGLPLSPSRAVLSRTLSRPENSLRHSVPISCCDKGSTESKVNNGNLCKPELRLVGDKFQIELGLGNTKEPHIRIGPTCQCDKSPRNHHKENYNSCSRFKSPERTIKSLLKKVGLCKGKRIESGQEIKIENRSLLTNSLHDYCQYFPDIFEKSQVKQEEGNEPNTIPPDTDLLDKNVNGIIRKNSKTKHSLGGKQLSVRFENQCLYSQLESSVIRERVSKKVSITTAGKDCGLSIIDRTQMSIVDQRSSMTKGIMSSVEKVSQVRLPKERLDFYSEWEKEFEQLVKQENQVEDTLQEILNAPCRANYVP